MENAKFVADPVTDGANFFGAKGEDWGEGDSFGDGAVKGAIGDGIIGAGEAAVSRFACGCGVSGF